MPRSLLRRAVPAAARGLDADDVAGVQLARQLRRLLLAVDEGSAARAVLPAGAARRGVASALGEHREPAVLEHAQLAHDAVAAAMRARRRPSRPRSSQRSTRSGYSSSIASTGVANVFDIATWTPLGPSASGHAPWPPPTVS